MVFARKDAVGFLKAGGTDAVGALGIAVVAGVDQVPAEGTFEFANVAPCTAHRCMVRSPLCADS